MLDISGFPPEQQFDFWLGTWDVSWGDGQHGTNQITRILDGQVIRESFDGNPGLSFHGLSLSVYSPKLKCWQQTWVDSEGTYWHFLGGLENGQMMLATDDVIDNQPVRLRMRFYNIEQDAFDWIWERSDDNGNTWQAKWQIRYQRRSG